MLMESASSDTLAMDMDGRRAGHFRRLAFPFPRYGGNSGAGRNNILGMKAEADFAEITARSSSSRRAREVADNFARAAVGSR